MFPFEKALNLPVPGTWAVSTNSAGEVAFGNVTDACKTQNEICFRVSLLRKESKIYIQEKNWLNVETKFVEPTLNTQYIIIIYNSYITNFNVPDLCSSAMLLKQ